MSKTNINFELTTEILYSYVYDKDMSYSNLDAKFKLPSGTSEAILQMCNIFKFCGCKIYQGKRNIPTQSIYKLARISNEDITSFLSSKGYDKMLDKHHIMRVISDDKYSRNIKNAFLKNAFDSRLEEIKTEKEKMKYDNLANSIIGAFKI